MLGRMVRDPYLLRCTGFLALLATACGDATTGDDEIGNTETLDGSSTGTSESAESESNDESASSESDSDSSSESDSSTDEDSSSQTESDTDSESDTTDTETETTDGQVCTPGTTQCVDLDSFEICDDLGQGWGNTTDCAPDEDCLDGQCLSLCSVAEAANSSVGCQYYAIDADNHDGYDTLQYAIAVSNVDDEATASVEVQAWVNNGWVLQQSAMVMPGSLHQFNMPDKHINLTGINARGAYRVVSDVPIIAYQFNPVDGVSSFTSDASLLLPVSALDEFYYVVGWGQTSFNRPEIQIVATADGTQVEITTSTSTNAGGGLQALAAGQTWQLPVLNEGDVAQFDGNNGFTGTYITSSAPIAVFSSHTCANVPSLNAACCCDHLEEQAYGLQTWGNDYVAARFPARNGGNPEPSYWHVFASEDDTTINIAANEAVVGIGQQNLMLDAGGFVEIAVDGSIAHPGDFFVSADKPISVVQYMSSQDAGQSGTGDPAMAQAVPVEQFRTNYVVLVPPNWINDFLVVTKRVGSTVEIDGVAIPEPMFVAVGPQANPTQWQVARVAASDGVHTLEGDQSFGVIVVGYDQYDSYAYPGGLNQQVINPQ
jgi:hypothetical protein